VYDALVVLAEAGQHVVHTCPSLCNQKQINILHNIITTRPFHKKNRMVIPR
jgi:hypothetical protein